MYESPIDIIYNDIQYKAVEEFDKNVVSAVQSYGIDVNKEELLKALRYDRQQYEKGYADAKSERRWIPITEAKPGAEHVLATLRWDEDDYEVTELDYWAIVAAQDDEDYLISDRAKGIIEHVLAWMPMPEPYKE